MANFSSQLIASLQGSLGTGQELTIPELAVATLSVGLPIQSTPSGTFVDLRNVQASAHCYQGLNQGNSSGILQATVAILDRGIYRLSGELLAVFTGAFTDTSADPYGVVLQLINPQGTFAQTICQTANKPATGSQRSQFGAFTYQFNQVGWTVSLSTFHSTGAAQTIGCTASVFVERLL